MKKLKFVFFLLTPIFCFAQPSNYYWNTEFRGWSGNTMTNNEPVSGAVQYTIQATSVNDEFVLEWNSGGDKWQQSSNYPIGSISTLYHCTSGCPNTQLSSNTQNNYYYTLNVKELTYSNVSAILHETSASPIAFAASNPISISPSAGSIYIGQDVVVTVNLAGSKSSQEKCFIRYHDGGSNSGVAEVSFTGSSGTATIPGSFNTDGRTVSYYAFTTTMSSAPSDRSDDGWTSLKFKDGSSYTLSKYSNYANGENGGACDGKWSTAACWYNGSAPTSAQDVEISNDITANASSYAGDLKVLNGSTLTLNGASAFIYLVAGKTFEVAGSFTATDGEIIFSNGGNISGSGTITFDDLELRTSSSTTSLNTDIIVNGHLDMNDGADLDMNTNTMELKGDWTRSGLAAVDDMGLVSFTGTGDQDLTGHVTFIAGCTINKSSGDVILVSNGSGTGIPIGMRIGNSSTLTLTSGNVDSRTNDTEVEIQSGSSISGGSSSSYIDGSLQINSVSGTKDFPVGKSSYNPATINNSGTLDDFTVEVGDYITTDGTSGGTVVSSDVVNRTWNISEGTAGGSNASITLQWGSGDEKSGFSTERGNSNVYVSHYTGGAWSAATAGAVSGSDPYTLTMTGVTSFSPFGVGGGGALPVSLIDFTAQLNPDNQTQLIWSTASELNASHFNVHRSIDGVERVKIGEVSASGNSNEILNYAYLDANPITQRTMYFIEQVDYDGTAEWFGPAVVNKAQLSGVTTSFSDGGTVLDISLNEVPEVETATVVVLNSVGQQVLNREINLSADQQRILLPIPAIATGVYIVNTQLGDKVYSSKLYR